MNMPPARRIQTFIQRNQREWEKLEELLAHFKKKPVDRERLDQLGEGYRQVVAHLAYARTYFPSHPITQTLNDRVTRAHQLLYGQMPRHETRRAFHFFTTQFPRLFHQRATFFLIALLLFTLGALFSFTSVLVDPANGTAFLPEEMISQINPHERPEEQWNHAVVSGLLMTNNIKVAFLCFALGALFGIGTVYVLITNGFLMGALAAIFFRAGESYSFWAYIWPHGVIELSAIFIAGAAGLSLASSWLIPHDQTRANSFKREGKVTIQLVIGVIPMFIIAGLIEGFLTPQPWPLWSKYLIALITVIGLFLYLARPFFSLARKNS